MKTEARKAAIAAYKETKSTPGIFALRCTATGAAWVGRAADLATIRNRLTFTLARGAHPDPELQAAWKAHGEAGFTFDPLERIEEDVANVRQRLLKERAAHWCDTLGATLI